ncbi:MAG: hypothetical protein M3O61_08315 [Gemmatimonadota bacterium]|nr:hypothetical protein [Gemmatimonadota bacterium]
MKDHAVYIEEPLMRRYELVSGIVFTIIAVAQATRTLLGWPVEVAGANVPVFASAVAFLVTGALAVWAFRSARVPPAM